MHDQSTGRLWAPPPTADRQLLPVALVFLSGLAAALTLVGQPQPVRFGAAVSLLWLLPGLSWALVLQDKPPAERLALGFGLAFAASGLLTLVLHLLPGPFPINIARLVYLAAAILPLANTLRSPPSSLLPPPSSLLLTSYSLLLLLACLTRFPNLGYSEFQGDEGIIMRRAALALAGDDGQLFMHQKGPVEILAPMSVWALTGTINEAQARLPFALVGLLAVGAVALLGARWFNPRVGALAGLVAAICGFLVAFSRIVQYQNVVVAMGALSLLALSAYARQGRLRDALLGALLMACGLLAHYDAVLFTPAALGLVVAGLVTRRAGWRRELGRLALAALCGAAVLAVFYAPFMVNPNFAKTFGYLAGDRLGSGEPFYNNTGRVWVMSTFYNSTYYIVGLLALCILNLIFQISDWLFTSPTTLHTLTAWLYFAAPFVFYLFLVFDPRTHVYTFYPGAAILAGAAAARMWDWARARKSAGFGQQPSSSSGVRSSPRGVLWTGRHRFCGLKTALLLFAQKNAVIVLALVGLIWYGLCAGYIGLAFINHTPEYKREWPTSQSALYPTTFQDLPLFGFFGFPYRAGWKAVEELYAQGMLAGAYASNEEPEITTWYVRGGARTLCGQPDLYIIAENVQDEIAVNEEELARDYDLAFQVTVKGRPKIHIYHRGAGAGPAQTVRAEEFARAFDRGATIAAQLPSSYGGAQRVGVDFDVARLLGYDLSNATPKRGDSLVVTLYWQALDPTERNYQVFAHLIAKGDLVAQHDGAPACTLQPTSGWEPGQIIRDEHSIAIPADAPPGQVELYVGMYDLITLERLPIAGAPDSALSLTDIEVLP